MALRDEEDASQQQPERIKSFYSSEYHHTIPTLPQEIIMEILLRLPVKSLLRCKSACTSWYFLISNPQFVKSHLSLSTSGNDYARHRILFIGPRNTIKSYPLYDVMHDKSANSLDLDYPMIYSLNFVRPWKDSVNFVQIVGSCNGLLCLKAGGDVIFILNPSTRRSNILPCFGFNDWLYGFGYDESSHDYKVVAISYIHQNGIKVNIYSLESKTWKKIDDFPHGIPFGGFGAYSNGALHWAVTPSFVSSSSSKIVSLNLARETYGEILPPVFEEGNKDLKLGVLGEWLCLLCSDYRRSHADVWVMKVYGVQDSWTKLVSIQNWDHFCWESSFPCFEKDGKMLWQCGTKLVMYDVKNGSSSEIKNYGGSLEAWSWITVESLASPTGPQRYLW